MENTKDILHNGLNIRPLKLMVVAFLIVATSVLMIADVGRDVYEYLFIFIFPVYMCCLLRAYYIRNKDLSMSLIFFFVYSMLLGIPACYLFVVNDSTSQFSGFMLCIILSSIFVFISRPFHDPGRITSINTCRLTGLFYFVFFIVAACQSFKIYAYLTYIIESGLGHLAIYINNDELVHSVPSYIRFISGLSMVVSLIAISFSKNKIIIFLALALMFSDIAIGIRGKAFSGVIAAFIIMLYVNKYKATRIFSNLTKPIVVVVFFVLFSFISYYREGYSINFGSYILLVLDSISSILSGTQALFDKSDYWYDSSFSSSSIFMQIGDLIGLHIDGVNTVAETYTKIALGDNKTGIALSSSLPLEAMVLGGPFGPLIMITYSLLMLTLINRLLLSNKKVFLVAGISILPGLAFVCRAELVIPFVYLIKSVPIILISPMLLKNNI